MLNYLSIGCAGFAILDPFRPIARVATIASILHMLLNRRTARAWSLSIISIMLLASQDMLALQNKSNRPSTRWLLKAVAQYYRSKDGDMSRPDSNAPMMKGDAMPGTMSDEARMTGHGLQSYSLGTEECKGGSERDYKFRVVGIKYVQAGSMFNEARPHL